MLDNLTQRLSKVVKTLRGQLETMGFFDWIR